MLRVLSRVSRHREKIAALSSGRSWLRVGNSLFKTRGSVNGKSRDLLEDFQNSRQEASAQLRNDLARDRAKISSEVKAELAGADALIKDYQSSRRMMGTQLKKELTRDRDERNVEVGGMLGDFRQARAEVRADLNKASQSWRGMASARRNKGNGGKTSPGVETEISTEISPDLKEKLFSIINQHNNGGITLSEVADTLGVATVTLSKAARTLQEEGKVRREGKLYFS